MSLMTTPLTALHRARGARIVPFAGYEMPVQYEGILAEHRAVRTRAGIFDVGHMGHCRVTSPAISRFLSRPLEKIAVGKSCYALIMNEEGGIVDDCISYRLGESLWHIVLNASRKQVDVETLRDVEPRFDLAMIACQGPDVVPVLGELCPRRGFAAEIEVLGVPVELAARTGYTGEDGFELVVRPQNAEPLWKGLLERGFAPCGLGSRDLLRIEAALPLYGQEISETIDPFEAGLGFAVDFDRGDFVGRAALERRKVAPTRRRAGLNVKKGSVPRHDHEVVDASGRVVGVVTSGTYSPLLDQGIALALVDKESTPSAVRIRGVDCQAVEVELPFYRRQVKKS